MSRFLLAPLAALALIAGACGDDDDETATTSTTSTSTTTTTSVTSTTEATETTMEAEPTADWTQCEHPDGFALSYPTDWSTNDGTVVGECSQFDPEPFTVPEGTDERVAAITAYVDPVPFEEASAPDDETDRSETTVDGHDAVRVVDPTSELRGDVEATRYMVDLGSDGTQGPRTLFIDTIDLPGTDYERNVEILDRMVSTMEIDA